MTGESASIEVAPGELGGALCAVRLRHPEAEAQMQLSLSKVGQLTPVQAWRTHRETGAELELFDGLKLGRSGERDRVCSPEMTRPARREAPRS